MKKLMTAFAACLIAGLVSAQIASQNVVGYSTVSLNPGFNMLALNFDTVGGGGTIPVQNLFATNGLTAGQSSGSSDQIQVWDGEKFTVYFYRANKTNVPKWTLGPAWVNALSIATPTADTIATGQGFWFNHFGTATNTTTVAGQVLIGDTKTHTLASGFNLAGSAFPVSFVLNGAGCPFDWSTATAGQSSGSSDQIQVWDGEKFTVYFYRANKTNVPKWTLGPAWVNALSIAIPTADTIPAGAGFWYNKFGTGAAITETSPLAAQ